MRARALLSPRASAATSASSSGPSTALPGAEIGPSEKGSPCMAANVPAWGHGHYGQARNLAVHDAAQGKKRRRHPVAAGGGGRRPLDSVVSPNDPRANDSQSYCSKGSNAAGSSVSMMTLS